MSVKEGEREVRVGRQYRAIEKRCEVWEMKATERVWEGDTEGRGGDKVKEMFED